MKNAETEKAASEPGTEPVASELAAAATDPSADTATPPMMDPTASGPAAKAQEYYERLLRVTADFDNFKKRAAREKLDAIKYANESLLQKLIPVLDNFDMALLAVQNASAENAASLQAGVTMIHQQLKNAVAESGLEEVDATGKPFDPKLHEALSQEETSAVAEDQVVRQLRKGYKLRDRLLRAANVVVAKKPANKS